MAQIKVLNTIRSVSSQLWDDLLGPFDTAGHGWLCTVEESLRSPITPHYIVLEERGRLLAAALCAVVEPSAEVMGVNQALLGRAEGLFRKLGLSFLPALVCTPFKVSGPHIAVHPELRGEARREVLRRIICALEAESAGLELPLVFQNIDLVLESELAAALAERGYQQTAGPPACSLEVKWRSFQEYLNFLRRKPECRSPSKVRQELRRTAAAGITIRAIEPWAQEEERAFELLNDHYLLRNRLPFYFRENFIPRLKHNLGERAILWGAFRGQRLIAISVAIRCKGALCLHAVGIDPEEARKNSTYFSLCYYHVAEYAAQVGLKFLYYGMAAYQAKVWRGCDVTPTAVYYKSNSAMKKLVLTPYFAFHRAWWQRRKIPRFVRERY